ncbi:hypothetical protein P0136_12530 [Lentisphaerota bacterium ZTH]|nr:hypothetical protein JYG24_09955 [Lentisphaerota bacterium]WET06184.1 hypothetical protein P0136_12530 [Lentisphaerota bacterium ZTH]
MKYRIISEDPQPVSSYNCLKIELYKRVDEQTLKEIAAELRRSRRQYNRLWIEYFIKGIDTNKGAWATSDFKLGVLDLRIIGSPLSKINKLTKSTVSQSYDQIIGRWLNDTPGFEHLTTIYTANCKVYVETNYINETYGFYELIKTEENGKTRYDKVNKLSNNTDYFIIEKNGNLSVYDALGKFEEDKKL